MKLLSMTLFTTVELANVDRLMSSNKLDQDRRYFQLTEMMQHFNPAFDERKYWSYGCNCLILGDRPMSDPGHGRPVDALDSVCKEYKDCLKCARMVHGESCIGEFVKYNFGIKNDQIICKDKADECGRALCECDARFAEAHVQVKDVFDSKYHMFWSTSTGHPMWDPANDRTQCPVGGSGPYDPQCCGGNGVAFTLYNNASKVCCSDGRVVQDVSKC